MQLKNSIKNKKKIVVTGAGGFLGKSVALNLLKNNYYVISVDLKNPNIKSSNHRYYKSTVKNFFSKKKIHNIYSIIHLAADPRNYHYYLKPELAIENISNLLIILNYLKKLKIKPSLIFSSTKQIEKDYLTRNLGPYSISKKTCEELIEFYSKNYGVKFHILRLSDIFSKINNPKNKALNKILNRSKNNQNIFIDNKKHNFEYVNTDVICEGILKILDKKLNYKYINFYGEIMNIVKLVKKINKNLKSRSKIVIGKSVNNKIKLKKDKILNYYINKKSSFDSNLNLIIENELKKK